MALVMGRLDVRLGSSAAVSGGRDDVRFAPETGQTASINVGPISATCGLVQCNKAA
jgi:hypothetical protein